MKSWSEIPRIETSSNPLRVIVKNALQIAKLNCINSIDNLLKCSRIKAEFSSPNFLVLKPDNSYRFILNLKHLNTFISPLHCKMNYYTTAKSLTSSDCCVEVLRCILCNFQTLKIFKFICLPFGLCTAPFLFTKLIKPVTLNLRKRDLLSLNYTDELLIFGYNKNDCTNATSILILFPISRFLINPEIRILIPS